MQSSLRKSLDNSQPGFEELKNTRPSKKPMAKVEKTDFSVDQENYKEYQTIDNKSTLSHKSLKETEK